MASKTHDPFVGPIYVPEETALIPTIASGASLEVSEILYPGFPDAPVQSARNIDSMPMTIPNTGRARLSLTNFYVEDSIVTNIIVEKKLSSGKYSASQDGITGENDPSWSQVGSFGVVWPGGATYNENFEVNVPLNTLVGGTKYDFRVRFHGADVKGEMRPINFVTGWCSATQINPTSPVQSGSGVYGKSGSVIIHHWSGAVDTNATQQLYFSSSNSMQGRVAQFVSGRSTTEVISGAFCCYSSSNFTSSWRWMTVLPSSEPLDTSVDGWNIVLGGVYTMSIYEDIIADVQTPFNGIPDISEVAGISSAAVEISDVWVVSGSTLDNRITLGWKSLWGTCSGWYTSANPNLTYSMMPTESIYSPDYSPMGVGHGSGIVWMPSGASYNLSNYRVYMWISTGSLNLCGQDVEGTLIPNQRPGCVGANTGGGSWYFFGEIPVPHITSSGLDNPTPDIEYQVAIHEGEGPRTFCFWIGAMCERTRYSIENPQNYEYCVFITGGASDNMSIVDNNIYS